MKNIKYIFVFVIMLLMIFMITGCEDDETDEEQLNSKALAEFEYIEEKIISIVENYLTGRYIVDQEIDWNEINDDFEEISNSSSVVILDLTSLGVENSKILDFENRANSVIVAISEENEIAVLETLKTLYELIPEYIEIIYPADRNLYLEKMVNENLLECLYYCKIGEFEIALDYIEEAENMYKELMEDSDFLSENSYNSNKIYVAIQEMKLAVQNESLENVISKYINTN